MRQASAPVAAALAMLLQFSPAAAATYEVGPTRTYSDLGDLLNSVNLEPGDIVNIDGDVEYPGGVQVSSSDGGAPGNPVIFRGITVNQQMPHLRGGTNTLHNMADHVVYENIEISGTGNTTSGTFRCYFHQGTGVTLRGVYIHDCPRQGILGADQGSGSLTVEYSRVVNSGSDDRNHAIYMSTDQVNFPGSVFRLQYSYVSDSQFDSNRNGGNLIKSRAERNEIYYNWLEGAFYHELELIGPDPGGVASGWSEGLAREDSDIVGNIIVHTQPFRHVLRFGGDATGQSYGRYRFVHNTVIARNNSVATVFRLFDGIGALEASNNILWNETGGSLQFVREAEADWSSGMTTISGSNNWIDSSVTDLPLSLTGTILGADPNLAGGDDFTPRGLSPVLDAAGVLQSLPGFEIANALPGPEFHPPQGSQINVGVAQSRPDDGSDDIGALERVDPGIIFFDGFE